MEPVIMFLVCPGVPAAARPWGPGVPAAAKAWGPGVPAAVRPRGPGVPAAARPRGPVVSVESRILACEGTTYRYPLKSGFVSVFAVFE